MSQPVQSQAGRRMTPAKPVFRQIHATDRTSATKTGMKISATRFFGHR